MDPLNIVSLVLALVAVVFAGWSALASQRSAESARETVRIEADRDERDEQARVREQAGQVTAWQALRCRSGERVKENGLYRGGVVIANASPMSIFEVRIESTWRGSGYWAKTLATLPHGEFYLERDPASEYHWDWLRASSEISDELRPQVVGKDCEVVVTFRDVAGRYWKREADGRLLELPKAE